jgi:hypothetical protein
MATPVKPSLKVEKTFTFRGSPKIWSNRYFVTGPAPADSAHWTTFSDAVVTAEKAALSNLCTITSTYGYAAGSDVPVFSKTYATVGLLTITGILQAGEVAALVRYSTSARTSKNHPLYLFNYYHSVQAISATSIDSLLVAQKTAFQTYANAWIAGFSDGTNLMVRCGPQGQVATAALAEANLTHRDFPRG